MRIFAELQWRGITPPPEGRTTARTTCPICSPYRAKKEEPCARVTITSNTTAKLWCHHCKTEESYST